MARKKRTKEIDIPSHIFSRPPKTRDEAVARLHFHFETPILHSRAIEKMDEWIKEHDLIPAYYFTVNYRDQIRKSLSRTDKKKYEELKNMKDNIDVDSNKAPSDSEVEAMIDTWDIVNCRQCGEKISMLTARKVSAGEDEYFVCKSGH